MTPKLAEIVDFGERLGSFFKIIVLPLGDEFYAWR
jgi:hypothetical protein